MWLIEDDLVDLGEIWLVRRAQRLRLFEVFSLRTGCCFTTSNPGKPTHGPSTSPFTPNPQERGHFRPILPAAAAAGAVGVSPNDYALLREVMIALAGPPSAAARGALCLRGGGRSGVKRAAESSDPDWSEDEEEEASSDADREEEGGSGARAEGRGGARGGAAPRGAGGRGGRGRARKRDADSSDPDWSDDDGHGGRGRRRGRGRGTGTGRGRGRSAHAGRGAAASGEGAGPAAATTEGAARGVDADVPAQPPPNPEDDYKPLPDKGQARSKYAAGGVYELARCQSTFKLHACVAQASWPALCPLHSKCAPVGAKLDRPPPHLVPRPPRRDHHHAPPGCLPHRRRGYVLGPGAAGAGAADAGAPHARGAADGGVQVRGIARWCAGGEGSRVRFCMGDSTWVVLLRA